MENLEKALISVTLINTIFQNYDAGELNSSGELVRSRIAKFLRQRSKSNRKLYIDVVIRVDKVWRDAINHFADKRVAIEAKTTISAIYNYFENEITKYAKVTDQHMEKFMIGATDNAEAELNSYEVVDYIAKTLGIEKQRSAISGKFLTIKNNLIIEGKKIDEKFA